jgi:hypothetical protein
VAVRRLGDGAVFDLRREIIGSSIELVIQAFDLPSGNKLLTGISHWYNDWYVHWYIVHWTIDMPSNYKKGEKQ